MAPLGEDGAKTEYKKNSDETSQVECDIKVIFSIFPNEDVHIAAVNGKPYDYDDYGNPSRNEGKVFLCDCYKYEWDTIIKNLAKNINEYLSSLQINYTDLIYIHFELFSIFKSFADALFKNIRIAGKYRYDKVYDFTLKLVREKLYEHFTEGTLTIPYFEKSFNTLEDKDWGWDSLKESEKELSEKIEKTKEEKDEKNKYKNKGNTAIPRGRYQIIMEGNSPMGSGEPYVSYYKEKGKPAGQMPTIKNVPGFQYIRIHSGNDPVDSLGCILIGTKGDNGGLLLKGGDGKDNSKGRWIAFMDIILPLLEKNVTVPIDISASSAERKNERHFDLEKDKNNFTNTFLLQVTKEDQIILNSLYIRGKEHIETKSDNDVKNITENYKKSKTYAVMKR